MRINTVAKARKTQGKCGRCAAEIEVGAPYRWIKFRYGGRRVRCLKCAFRSSELTQSKMSQAYAAQEDGQDAVEAAGCIQDVRDALEEAASNIREVSEEYQESADNIREAFSDSPTADECEEKAQELEGWVDEVEGVEPDDCTHDEDGEDVDDKPADSEDCDDCLSTAKTDADSALSNCPC